MLRVSGKRFESSKYSKRTDVPVANVYVRGDPRFRSDPTGKKNMTSGMTITVSRADFTNFKRQVRDATAFLARHKRQLARLRNNVGVEEMVLDFGVADRDVAAQFDYFPPDLLLAAGKLGMGIEMSR